MEPTAETAELVLRLFSGDVLLRHAPSAPTEDVSVVLSAASRLLPFESRSCVAALVGPDGRCRRKGTVLSEAGLWPLDDDVECQAVVAALPEFVSAYPGVFVRLEGGVAGDAVGVKQLRAFSYYMSALIDDGTVLTWTTAPWPFGEAAQTCHTTDSLNDAEELAATENACAALRRNGRVAVWGLRDEGGDSATTKNLEGVVGLSASKMAFAALQRGGTVFVWGNYEWRGERHDWRTGAVALVSGATELVNCLGVFAALLDNGRHEVWDNGCSCSCSSLPGVLLHTHQSFSCMASGAGVGPGSYLSVGAATAHLSREGVVRVWGCRLAGGDAAAAPTEKVLQLVGSGGAFAALLEGGGVEAWGDARCGGDASRVDLQDVRELRGSTSSFAALTGTGRVIVWGGPWQGGVVVAENARGLSASHLDRFAAVQADGSLVRLSPP